MSKAILRRINRIVRKLVRIEHMQRQISALRTWEEERAKLSTLTLPSPATKRARGRQETA